MTIWKEDCDIRKAMCVWSLGISLYLELICFLSFVLRNFCSGTCRSFLDLAAVKGKTELLSL